MSSDLNTGKQKPWWNGKRGEWYVVIQLGLIALLLFGPVGEFTTSPIVSAAGWILLLMGVSFLITAIFKHGKNITPVPYPQDQATLIESGPYKLVRHPMYCGGILFAFGWALCVHGWLTILYAVVIFVFLDIKARREEGWLREKFPEYGSYQLRVRKLIPFIY